MFPVCSRKNQFKFKTSSNIKILNPLVLLQSLPKANYSVLISKASEVMSPVPPASLNKLQKGVSRLLPIVHHNQPYCLKSRSPHFKIPINNCSEDQRHSGLSFDFDKPIRDYFEETVQSEIVSKHKHLQVSDVLEESNADRKQESKLIPEPNKRPNFEVKKRYSSIVVPFSNSAVREKTLQNQKFSNNCRK